MGLCLLSLNVTCSCPEEDGGGLSCTAPQILNAAGDACVDSCPASETPNSTNDACITPRMCGTGQVANADNDACIDQTTCEAVGTNFYADTTTGVCRQCPMSEIRNTAGDGCVAPVYIWATGCTVRGDMMGGDCTGGTGSGVDRADSICEANEPDEIPGTYTSQAILYTPSRNPSGFVSDNARPIRRPNGTTRIADNYAHFFDPDRSITNPVQDTMQSVWTGAIRMTTFVVDASNHCQNWTAALGFLIPPAGRNGDTIQIDPRRFNDGTVLSCTADARLLCVSY